MHQLYTNYARYIYARSMHTFRKWYVYYDIRNTIFLRYEMLSSLCPLPCAPKNLLKIPRVGHTHTI